MDDDEPGLRLVHLLRRVSVEFELFRTEFGNLHQLHPTDLRALIQLLDARRAQTAATPGWLGEQLGLNSAGTTALIDRLETAGHVRRERDTLDRRRVLLVVEDRAIEVGWTFFGPLFTDMIAAHAGIRRDTAGRRPSVPHPNERRHRDQPSRRGRNVTTVERLIADYRSTLSNGQA